MFVVLHFFCNFPLKIYSHYITIKAIQDSEHFTFCSLILTGNNIMISFAGLFQFLLRFI